MNTRDLIRRMHRIREESGYIVTEDQWESLLESVRAELPNLQRGMPALPDETVAVTHVRHKTASLLFDKVWCAPGNSDAVPAPFICYGGTEEEIRYQVLLGAMSGLRELSHGQRKIPVDDKYSAVVTDDSWSQRAIAEALGRSGMKATPVYQSRSLREREYRAGSREVLLAMLDDVALVDDDRITWEQVTEVRQDVESRLKYRRFLHWLDAEMLGRDVLFIQDEILIRLDQYEATLRKHGLATIIGAVESLINPSFVASASALFAGVTFVQNVAAGSVATLLLTGANLTCSITRGLMDVQHQERAQFSEVAYVHELKGLSG